MYDSIIILGPTASGKTTLSIELAKLLNSEIVNADSMYIYKDLNIGTAKPTNEEMNGIKHHLISFVNPEDSMNVSIYRENAEQIINDLHNKNILPIIVGGTGFYIDSLITTNSYGETEKNELLRKDLEDEFDKVGGLELHKKLESLDKESADKIHYNDKFRLIRSLEMALTGTIKSQIINFEKPILENPLIFGLNIPRDILYSRINSRVDSMIENGLVDEVKNLIDLGLNPTSHQCMKGIGYKEIYSYLNNEISLDESIEKIKQHTRNYAKRQITWFKRNKNIIWLDGLLDKNILIEKILNQFNNTEIKNKNC
jgi:tRNA dimethylallyltransferase